MLHSTPQSPAMQTLVERLQPLYARLATHPLYRSFEQLEDLHLFMEQHVYAVWDFMSLLKSLQGALTCVTLPWLPSAMPASRRFINEIVLGEESDVYRGQPISHFELYLTAMRECGADTSTVTLLLGLLAQGKSVDEAMLAAGVPNAAQSFVRSTFASIAAGKLHATAAAFTFGREDLIPDMFRGFIREQNERLSGRLETFRWYLDRHIEVDGDEHGPLALQMIAELCGNDEAKWQEAGQAAEEALHARIALWDGVQASIRERTLSPVQ